MAAAQVKASELMLSQVKAPAQGGKTREASIALPRQVDCATEGKQMSDPYILIYDWTSHLKDTKATTSKCLVETQNAPRRLTSEPCISVKVYFHMRTSPAFALTQERSTSGWAYNLPSMMGTAYIHSVLDPKIVLLSRVSCY